ncbi:MAG: hypothetical protein R2855_08990 [Thermomicrobiales bacterium]
MDHIGNRAGSVLHRFQKRRLRLGRRAIDLVSQDQIGKNRTALEREAAVPALGFDQNVRAGDVCRHQVRCELDAAERELQRVRQCAHQHRFSEPRHAFEQCVSPGEYADEHLFDDIALADHDLGDLRLDAFESLPEIRNTHAFFDDGHDWPPVALIDGKCKPQR